MIAAWMALLAAAVFAVLPSAPASWFNGLPVDDIPEFVLLLALVAAAASTAVQRALGRRGRLAIVAAAAGGTAAKTALIVSGAYAGFLACYHGGTSTSGGACDPSFDNLWHRFAVTRLDSRLDFDGAQWRLGILNDLRFDAERDDEGLLPPVPFRAEWTTIANAPSPDVLTLSYTGRVAVVVDGVRAESQASYDASTATLRHDLPAGRHDLRIDYEFEPPRTARTPRDEARLHAATGGDVRWGSMTARDALLTRISDALGLAVLAILLGALTASSPASVVVSGAVVAAALLLALVPAGAYLHDKAIEMLVIAACCAWVATGRPAAPAALVALGVLCLVRTMAGVAPAPGVSTYRLRLNDGLSYETFARDIFVRASLRAGEDVFSIQQLFRYVRFLERALFGESEWLIVTTAMTVFNAAYSWLAREVRQRAPPHALATIAVLAVLLVVVNGLSGSVDAPMSEYPTWQLVPVIGALLFLGRTRLEWFAGAILVAVATLTRFNQLPAYAMLLLVFAAARGGAIPRPSAGTAAACVALAAALIVVLPLAHNYYYGHALIVLPYNRYSHDVIDLPLASLLHLGSASVRQTLLLKVGQVLHIGVSTVFLPLHLLQAAFVATVIAMWRGILRPTPWHAALLLAPLLALAVHVVYVVHFYYPRHIVFGHLLAGVVILVLLAEDGVNRRAEPPDRHGAAAVR
jgi:hypothetical protein